MQIYPENKTSSFTVQLPEKISLNGKWVLALAEIHYNYNFFNISHGNNGVSIHIHNESDSRDSEHLNHIVKLYNKKNHVEPGYYNKLSDVVSIINNHVKNIMRTDLDIISFNEVNARVTVNRKNISQNISQIRFDDKLSIQMGFAPGDNILHFENSPYAGNISFGIPDQMMIYTDIIEPSFIGHEKAYVLKIVNTQAKSVSFGDSCYKEFNDMHYMPIQKREFESISVNIRDYNGNYMPFLHGILTIKLHFKRQDV